MNTKNGQRFKQYESRYNNNEITKITLIYFSVSDVWNSEIQNDLVYESANRVLEQHANNEFKQDNSEQTHYDRIRSQNNKTSAMQRLALQKG